MTLRGPCGLGRGSERAKGSRACQTGDTTNRVETLLGQSEAGSSNGRSTGCARLHASWIARSSSPIRLIPGGMQYMGSEASSAAWERDAVSTSQ